MPRTAARERKQAACRRPNYDCRRGFSPGPTPGRDWFSVELGGDAFAYHSIGTRLNPYVAPIVFLCHITFLTFTEKSGEAPRGMLVLTKKARNIQMVDTPIPDVIRSIDFAMIQSLTMTFTVLTATLRTSSCGE